MMDPIVTVTTAASSYDLTTLANVKAELDISNGDSDTLLRRYISGASKAAAHYCNRVFAVETVSEQFLMTGHHRFNPRGPLQLTRWPLITVTSVTEDDTLLTVDDDYVVNAINGQLTRMSGDVVSCWSALGVTVVYSSGYATVPADLEDAVVRMVTRRYRAKGRDATLRSEEIPGVISQQFWIATGDEAGNLTPDVLELLNAYRSMVIA